VVNESLLKRMLRSSDYHARAAATRVLCYWRDRVKDPLALLKAQATDEHPRVRLEAIRACSFFTTKDVIDVALSSLDKEANPDKLDYYIKYCLDETMKALAGSEKGSTYIPKSPKAADAVFSRLSNKELVALPRQETVLLAFLKRKGLDAKHRDEA